MSAIPEQHFSVPIAAADTDIQTNDIITIRQNTLFLYVSCVLVVFLCMFAHVCMSCKSSCLTRIVCHLYLHKRSAQTFRIILIV